MFVNKYIKYFVLVFIFLIGCDNSHQKSFQNLSSAFLDWYYRNNPIDATWLGIHEYDSNFGKYTKDALNIQYDDIGRFLIELDQIDFTKLTKNDQIDYFILENAMMELQFNYEVLKYNEWNPMLIPRIIGNGISTITDRNYAPVELRTISLLNRIKEIPRVVNELQTQLLTSPEIYTTTAIKQVEGNISLLNNIPIIMTADSNIMDTLDIYITYAKNSLKQYKNWLENDLLPRSKKNFRLGKDNYHRRFQFSINENISPEIMLKNAYESLRKNQLKMFHIALPIYLLENDEPIWVTKKDTMEVINWVLDEIALDHGSRDNIIEDIRDTLDELESFINNNHLINLDESEPLMVRITPEYQRGVAIASLDAPGPMEKKLNTFYNVSPIPDEWSDEQVESYLREYNNISIKILSIHEALPGHYVQLYYSKNNFSKIRSVFSSGVMIEGWAHYCEGMMIDAGFGNGDPRYKLVQLKWALRGIINAIIDYEIHVNDMSKEEVIKVMIEEGFQERSEAEGKWVRAQLSSCQLTTYFIGTTEMWNLRHDYEKKMGKNFNLKQFHEKILSFGSIPIKYIRKAMLDY